MHNELFGLGKHILETEGKSPSATFYYDYAQIYKNSCVKELRRWTWTPRRRVLSPVVLL